MLDELKFQEIKMVYVTLLDGVRTCLCTNRVNKIAYDAKLVLSVDATTTPLPKYRPTRFTPKFSVNDDFEISISMIQNGRRLHQRTLPFLHQMLTPYQLKLMEAKDGNFLKTFDNHLAGDPLDADVPPSELIAFPDTNLKMKFVKCLCERHSFSLLLHKPFK